MSHSIVDNGDADITKLTLIFINGGEEIAKLRIANVTKTEVCQSEETPDYIDVKDSINIQYVKDIGSIDSVTPIQIYCNKNSYISPILLLEETDYDLELEILQTGVSDELSYLQSNGDSVSLKMNCFSSIKNKMIYSLYFKSYVGKGFFNLKHMGKSIQIPFEVRSKKIGYLYDYPQMLSDIAEFSVPILLDYNSPLYRNYSQTYGSKNPEYEDFLILEYVFDKLDIIGAYAYVKNHIYSNLVPFRVERNDGSISNLDPASLIDIVNGTRLVKDSNGVIMNKYSPVFVNNTEFVETFDIPENQLIKDLLAIIQFMVYHLSCSRIYEKSAYIRNSLDSMRIAINDCLSDSWLHDIGNFTHFPSESTVLQSKHGYRELFLIYHTIGANIAFSQDDIPGLLEGHSKKVYEVYEYWCYTRLFKCLSNMSINKPELKCFSQSKDFGS